MLCQLRRHPDTPCDAVDSMDVDVQRGGTNLLLCYRVHGRVRDIRIPLPAAPSRKDQLWRHTCFEAFLQSEAEGYHEFNLSPSTEWAAYSFNGYREGMEPVSCSPPPEIAAEVSDSGFELRATLALDETAALRLGLSAVIEETTGRKSYWALAHPPGRPDFHHPDCFALELPPASDA